MKPYLILDLESQPAPEARQREVMPVFDVPKTIKDPAKIESALIEKEQAWLASGALDAARGEIIAVGLLGADLDAPKVILGPEKGILVSVRELSTVHHDLTLVGHNLLGFDVPFLCRRMWVHGIKPPAHWLDCTPWKANKWSFDTMLAWACGNREQRVSLDMLAWALGCGRKNGSGKDFAKLLETDREAAIGYLTNDLVLTEAVYLKMQG